MERGPSVVRMMSATACHNNGSTVSISLQTLEREVRGAHLSGGNVGKLRLLSGLPLCVSIQNCHWKLHFSVF
jgi:hypothetical protein